MAYNYWLTTDLQKAPEDRMVIKDEIEIDGVRCYKVLPPMKGEFVQKFFMFSDLFAKKTLTEEVVL